MKVVSRLPFLYRRKYEILKQMTKVGFDSVPLVLITSAFAGLVTAVQASYQTKGYIPKDLLGVFVGKSVMTELAPVLMALVLTGKIGASISAEIGTMKVTEQIDALEVMAVSPEEILYMPRILAGAVMLPILTSFSIIIAILAGYLYLLAMYHINGYSFFSNMKDFFSPFDLWGGLIKSFFFGLVITSIGCFTGKSTEGGAEGVGNVTMTAVVYSSISILMLDFIVANLLFGG